MRNKRIENLESRIEELEYKEVGYFDLSNALQYAIILSWSMFILFAIFIFWFAPSADIDYDNLAYWECHNETSLTGKVLHLEGMSDFNAKFFNESGQRIHVSCWGYLNDWNCAEIVEKEVCEVVRK